MARGGDAGIPEMPILATVGSGVADSGLQWIRLVIGLQRGKKQLSDSGGGHGDAATAVVWCWRFQWASEREVEEILETRDGAGSVYPADRDACHRR